MVGQQALTLRIEVRIFTPELMTWTYLAIAAEVAIRAPEPDHRQYAIGAVGIRRDGVIVSARNLAAALKNVHAGERNPFPKAHAEYRLIQKMGSGGVIFVCRVTKDGNLLLARPCKRCMDLCRHRRIERVYYSINNNEFGVVLP